MKNMDDVKNKLYRGNLLWEGMRMMLPEHKEKLIQQERDDWKVELHGELDVDQWREIGEVVMDALNHTLTVRLTYWQDGYYVERECYIYKVDDIGKRVRIEYGPTDDSIREWIDMRVIYDVQRV
ncbi:YolD-like family protein [Shouchella clausii]|uniref:YolD-like family protein n=1 Tax=Shouchella TaxID=2893057 RepID=UPI0004E7A29C|nr:MULTISPECIES: YolD-like family protein [Shouchella]MBU3266282.1 YolD-like family protein [Shouchella clausii]MBU3509375.1 YolD-like family protein [Shouchella clausii]MDP0461986.1 YolD-like family protein [Shouchella rhizosphaerae]MDP5267781.1 YolD-like family protein [Shouchella clausii]MDP5305459.1 YolD-like family protein [Shouchella clausii]